MLLISAFLLFHASEAFSPATSALSPPRLLSTSSAVVGAPDHRNPFQLRASSEEDGGDGAGLPPLPSQKDSSATKEEPSPIESVAAPPVAAVSSNDVVAAEENDEGASYPINLPSPVLLATSMVLAIASTGSLFELAGGGSTKLGFGPTAALAAIGLPLSIFLIYAAILKGAAETEEDDQEYNNNKPRRL